MNGPSQRTDRRGLRALALAALFAISGCTGGPHPLPPDSSAVAMDTSARGPSTATAASTPTGTPSLGDNPTSTTPPAAPTGSAGSLAVTPMMPAAAGASASPTQPASGTSTPPATTPPPAGMTPPGGAPSGAAGASGGASQPSICEGTTATLVAGATAPSTLLLVLDRSADMAGDFQGAPRWKRSSEALTHSLMPRATSLTLGALLYPSTQCQGSSVLCQLQGQAMCTVNPVASQDQVAFQPAPQALNMLTGPSAVYAPVTAEGVPLAESLQRADAALASQPMSAKTSVVVIASSTPSCNWDAARASEVVKRWNDRGVHTFVVALPGTGATSDALRALAEAGGTADVRAPQSAGALEAVLQSVAYDSLASCSLALDPPATNLNAVDVRVTQMGTERSLPRTSNGEMLWTISADGKTVTLLGSACDAAKGGDYDAIRIVLGCAQR